MINALLALDHAQLLEAHYHAQPIALLGITTAAANGTKTKMEDFDPFGRILAARRAKEAIPERVAKMFNRLYLANKIPHFVLGEVDLEQIKSAAQ